MRVDRVVGKRELELVSIEISCTCRLFTVSTLVIDRALSKSAQLLAGVAAVYDHRVPSHPSPKTLIIRFATYNMDCTLTLHHLLRIAQRLQSVQRRKRVSTPPHFVILCVSNITYVFRPTERIPWMLSSQGVSGLRFRRYRRYHRAFDEPWAQTVDMDAIFCVVDGHLLGHANHCMLS